jgi:hypothetical protein
MKVKEYAGFGAKPLRARVNTDEFRANYSETFAQGELTNAQVFELARDDESIGEARERLRREALTAEYFPVAPPIPEGTTFTRVELPPGHSLRAVGTNCKFGEGIRARGDALEIVRVDDPRFSSAFPLGKCVCWDTGCYSCRCKDAGRGV